MATGGNEGRALATTPGTVAGAAFTLTGALGRGGRIGDDNGRAGAATGVGTPVTIGLGSGARDAGGICGVDGIWALEADAAGAKGLGGIGL